MKREAYVPGWGPDMMHMLSTRTADERMPTLVRRLRPGMHVLDIGCGPANLSVGLARAVSPGGRLCVADVEPSQIDLARETLAREGLLDAELVVASAYALPFADGSFDAVVAHAVFEHLARPHDALREMARVLRPTGLLGLCSSDWSGAVVEPRTADVEEALAAHCRARRLAGADPFAGSRLEEWIGAVGFTCLEVAVSNRVDMPFLDLARFIESRLLEAAARHVRSEEGERLARGAAAARRWAELPEGRSVQRWVEVVALRSDTA